MVAAAVIGAAVVGAAATTYASNKASSSTQSATNAAIAQQNQALQQQATLSQPYRDIATGGAIDQYKNLLGIGKQGTAGIESTLAATPGYQFAKTQGIDATKAAAGSMGLALSGNTLQGIDQFSTGLADQTYQTTLGNSLNAVQLGQAAAAGQAANIGNAAANTSGLIMNQGNTNASIYANEAAGLSRIAGNAAGQYATYNTLRNLNSVDAGPGVDTSPVTIPQTPTLEGAQYNPAWS